MEDMDHRINALEGKIADLREQILALELTPPGARAVQPRAPGEHLAEWIGGVTGGSGVVVDPGLARSTQCTRVTLPDNLGAVVFSPGIVGPLDDDQVALYCAEGIEDRTASPDQLRFLGTMHQASRLCGTETSAVSEARERIDAYYSCLGRELKKRGDAE